MGLNPTSEQNLARTNLQSPERRRTADQPYPTPIPLLLPWRSTARPRFDCLRDEL